MPLANTEIMNIFLQTVSGQNKNERIILCMDKAAWHTTSQLNIPQNMIIWFLPLYSPELNPVKLIWRELRTKYLNNRTLDSIKEVEDYLCFAIQGYILPIKIN